MPKKWYFQFLNGFSQEDAEVLKGLFIGTFNSLTDSHRRATITEIKEEG